MFQCTFHPSSLATLHVVGSMGHQITAKPGISEIRRIKHCPTRLTSPLEVIMKSLDQTRTDTPCVPPANGRPCRAIASSQCSHRAASHCHSVLTTPPGVRHWQPSEDRLRGISMKTAIGTRQIRLLSGANVPVVQWRLHWVPHCRQSDPMCWFQTCQIQNTLSQRQREMNTTTDYHYASTMCLHFFGKKYANLEKRVCEEFQAGRL